MRQRIPTFLVRALVALLAVEVADTPIFCADERPGLENRSVSREAAPSGVQASAGAAGDDDASCFCPCHLTFESEDPYRLASAAEPTEIMARTPDGTPPAAPRDLDHPPQNLG